METKDLPGYYRHGGEVRGSRNAAPSKRIGAAALLATTPGYADGGVVQTIKGFFGLGKKKDPLPADLNKMPPPGAGQAASQPAKEEPKSAISQYNGMSIMKRREAELGLKDGGMVRGPGSGTSDSVKDSVRPGTFIMPADSTKEIGASALSKMSKVPVRLSNGEYKLTPEQVHAIGVQTLEGMKDATHEPARKAYADGGRVEWDGADTAKAAAIGAGAAAAGAGKVLAPVASAFGQSPASLAWDIAKTSAKSVKGAEIPGMPKGALGKAGALGALASTAIDAWNTPTEDYRTRFGMNTNDPSLAGDLVARGLGAASDLGNTLTLGLAGKHLFRDKIQQANNPATTPAAQALSTPPESGTPTNSSQAGPGAGRGNFNPAPVNPSAPRPVAQPKAREIAPGIYRSGNSYADSPEAAVAGTVPGRLPNLQNMSAAEVLASRNGAMPGGGGSDVMGIYDRASKALAGTVDAQRQLDAYGPGASGGGAAGMGGDPGAGMRKFKEESTLDTIRQAMQQGGRGAADAMQAWTGLQGQNAQLQAAQMREQGDTNRLNTREAGENTRAGMRSAADARRDGISAALAMGKLDLERNAQGFTNRKLTREENLYSQYDAAKTPEERASIAQKIRDLSGKVTDPKDNFMVVGGGQEWDQKAMAMRNVPQRLMDLRTGKEVGAGQQDATLPAGMKRQIGTSNGRPVYEDANGNQVIAKG